MSTSFERKLLIVIALFSVASALGSLVLVFRMQDTADALAQRSHLNRYLVCQVLITLKQTNPLCDDIDPPSVKEPK